MLFRQLFDIDSCTYTYLIAGRAGGQALLIDPVKRHIARYLQLITELNLQLAMAIDTHIHADHISAIGILGIKTGCTTMLGEQAKTDCPSYKFHDGEKLAIEGLDITAVYTPGHTNDSYCFMMPDRILTGDTLLIRATGRTDFQNGNPKQAYASLFNTILCLPDDTLVYPGHDYNGRTVSTIGEEKKHNPRLQVASADEYMTMMQNLNLPLPKHIDIAVPANLNCGLTQAERQASIQK